jgi:rubrerythrin
MDKSVSDILEIAIKREEEAYDFYMDIHAKVADASVKETLEFIAGEETKHKAFLVNYRDGNFGEKALRMSAVVDYKIAAYLEEPQVDENMKSEDVYLVASHREQRSYLLNGQRRVKAQRKNGIFICQYSLSTNLGGVGSVGSGFKEK